MRRLWERYTRPGPRRWIRMASGALVAIGLILLVIAGINLMLRQSEGRQTQARRSEPTTRPTIDWKSLPALSGTATPLPAASPLPTAPATPAPGSLPTTAEGSETPEPTPIAVSTVASITAAPGPPARIVFSDLGIDAQVVAMGWRVTDVGGTRTSTWDLDAIRDGKAGHLSNSGLPGQPGNVVISGHHNIEGEVFKAISLAWNEVDAQAQPDGISALAHTLDGRVISIYDAAGQRFDYVVQGMYKLADRDSTPAQRQQNARFMAPSSDAILTLITCWPYTNNTHRIVVVAGLAGGEG